MEGRTESRGFTLIELMIVVAVIAILMSITVRVLQAGESDTQRSETLIRMHKIENCLSGYYAAFGAYPQVKLHNSRDIYLKSENTTQSDERCSESEMWSSEGDAWGRVQNACLAQPVAAKFPFANKTSSYVKRYSDQIKRMCASGKYPKISGHEYAATFLAGFDALDADSLMRFVDADPKTDYEWRKIKVFQFGLLSFLLPRYLVMMGGASEIYETFAQWSEQNETPSDPYSGQSMTWKTVHEYVQIAQGEHGQYETTASQRRALALLMNVPSQAVCGRWIANLEQTVYDPSWSVQEIMGVNVGLPIDNPMFEIKASKDAEVDEAIIDNLCFPDPNSMTRGVYLLCSATLVDGYGDSPNFIGRPFYYYSPMPYQTYTLWSAGKNGKTFPPWISLKKFQGNAKALEWITEWISDDIVGMSR